VKYAEAGVLLSNRYVSSAEEAQDTLIEVLEDWQEKLQLPRLSTYGMTEADIDRVVKNARGNSMKTNPVQLTNGELAALIESRL
jgi:alcohol dehydrogenase